MRHSRGRVVEVVSLADLDRRLDAGADSMSGWRVRGLDLTSHSEALARPSVAGALFLGCTFADNDDSRLRERGAMVFPAIPDVPIDPYRHGLYAPRELYDAPRYRDTLDARAYAWSQRPAEPDSMLAQALHDHAIDDALAEWTADRRLVGVMGGHALGRDDAAYADAARLGRALGGDLTVATGGGPGAMEAANLGAYLSGEPEDALTEALDELSRTPSFRPSIGEWAHRALALLDRLPRGGESLGIPTWHYGHEPSNVFATEIAKYFRNAPREAILLEVCDAGIVFMPGTGGTIQEIFQDACENYYADEATVAPMVLVGATYWTETLPAWPLLRSLAQGRVMEPHVHLVDSLPDAVDVVLAGTAVPPR